MELYYTVITCLYVHLSHHTRALHQGQELKSISLLYSQCLDYCLKHHKYLSNKNVSEAELPFPMLL